MLTQEDDVENHALARRAWSKSAIARHTGRERKTVGKYLAGLGPSRERAPSCLEPDRAYLEARFADNAHVFASVLFGELVALGFDRSYPTLVREIRELGLRPVCECRKAGGVKVTVGLDHEPGEELQLDWLELGETPWGEKAYVLVGALSHSGRVRGVLDLVQGLHAPLRTRLGLREGAPEALRQLQRRQRRGPTPIHGCERLWGGVRPHARAASLLLVRQRSRATIGIAQRSWPLRSSRGDGIDGGRAIAIAAKESRRSRSADGLWSAS